MTNKQELRGLSVEAHFYLAECCNCGEVMPSSKLIESRNYMDGDADCYCPHCNADDCDIADMGSAASEAWNYQQKRIEALLDELEAAEKRIAELEERNAEILRQARSFREAHESASEIIRGMERIKPVVTLPTTRLWAGKVPCFEEEEIISSLAAAGIITKVGE